MPTDSQAAQTRLDKHFDWKRVAETVLTSRLLDLVEETRLVPERKVTYQFSARGHELAQVLLGCLLNDPNDGISAYYRSRPMLLTMGLTLEDAMAAPLMRSGGFSDGRDIGVVCNMPPGPNPTVFPMAGEVGSQFTPAAGWAQAIDYHHEVLKDDSYSRALALAHCGDGAVATNGFWSCLTIATTLRLPLLFFVDDNAYGISVPSVFQTPGGNIARNLASFGNLEVIDGDGTDPIATAALVRRAVDSVRHNRSPTLMRLTTPRLSGHSGQDTQAYKSDELREAEIANDPLKKLRDALIPAVFSEDEWTELENSCQQRIETALDNALARPEPDPARVTRYTFCETNDDGTPELQQVGGIAPTGHTWPATTSTPDPEPSRINMLTAIRRTLEHELKTNPRLLIFGEDVGPKGGVHAATLGLQQAFGAQRVFDTSLNEEGIIGRAVGMAIAGLTPVPEIQFRKYADPAAEQIANCGSIRWRTANRFAAPMVVRMPGGYAKIGDPWHSMSGEVQFAHAIGWHVAMPSNAQDAVGLLRTAMRGNDPVIFFEHRALLDGSWARRPYPGDDFAIEFGRAKVIQPGDDLTVVTWGAMVERVEQAAKNVGRSIEIIDLRTIAPWDEACVLGSVSKTNRCLIVHEDAITAGFGAEIAAVLAERAFMELDAPIARLAVPDTPIPHNVGLMSAVVPSVEQIADKMNELITF